MGNFPIPMGRATAQQKWGVIKALLDLPAPSRAGGKSRITLFYAHCPRYGSTTTQETPRKTGCLVLPPISAICSPNDR
jgi:hypothetical protein